MYWFPRVATALVVGMAWHLADIPAVEGAPLTLSSPTALYSQAGYPHTNTSDGNPATGMGFDPNMTQLNVLAWEVTPIANSGAGLLTLQIQNNFGSAHAISRFRLAATNASQLSFADGAGTNGDVWPAPGAFTLLSPLTATSTGGSTMTITPDNFITVTGTNPGTNTYTITALAPLSTITGFRMEIQPSFNATATTPGPGHYVGRAANGNAVLSEFTVDLSPSALAPLLANGYKQQVLQNATQTFAQGGFPASEAIDAVFADGLGNGWAVSGGQTVPQSAVFQTSAPLDAGDVIFELDFASQFADHKIKQFRLSYTTDPNPTATGSATWTVIDPTFIDTSRSDSSIVELAGNIMQIGGTAAGAQPDFISVVAEDVNAFGITGFRLEAFVDGGTLGFGPPAGNFVLSEFQVFATAVPEPSSIAVWSVLGIAGLGLAGWSRKKKR